MFKRRAMTLITWRNWRWYCSSFAYHEGRVDSFPIPIGQLLNIDNHSHLYTKLQFELVWVTQMSYQQLQVDFKGFGGGGGSWDFSATFEGPWRSIFSRCQNFRIWWDFSVVSGWDLRIDWDFEPFLKIILGSLAIVGKDFRIWWDLFKVWWDLVGFFSQFWVGFEDWLGFRTIFEDHFGIFSHCR